MAQSIRNVAIIAHVDHGKTTLVDGLLKQAGTFRAGEVVAERAMDSNDLERERGITILSKCTAVTWKGVRINIVDTPGHADFGGEVERVLGMVDSVLLLVDAYEGAMPQTRFVTQKAFEMGLSPIVVVNKIDRPGVDPHEVMDQVFTLFDSLGASDAQLDFPVIYASGRQGYAIRDLNDEKKDLAPLLDLIVEKVPPAGGDPDAPLLMQVATLDYDDYLGYLAIGRMRAGRSKVGDRVLLAHRNGKNEEFRVQKVLGFQGLKRFELAEALAGDIVAFTGMAELNVGETITSIQNPTILPLLKVDAPTITMNFRVNDGPFAGREGKWVTSRNLKERLDREIKSNVALRVEETAEAGVFKVSGRGELHLSVLIETMRREGYELAVGKPEVIFREIDGEVCEPYEFLVVDVPHTHIGPVIELKGLVRLKSYVGKLPTPRNFADGAEILRRLFAAQFPLVTAEGWLAAAHRTWLMKDGALTPTYDVRLARTLADVDIERPLPPLWNEFDSLVRLPMLVIRGANSDILSAATVEAMAAHHPGMQSIEVPDQGHVPALAGDLIATVAQFVAACDGLR